jgi:hypothetical protein
MEQTTRMLSTKERGGEKVHGCLEVCVDRADHQDAIHHIECSGDETQNASKYLCLVLVNKIPPVNRQLKQKTTLN